jgi:hypothetical protein
VPERDAGGPSPRRPRPAGRFRRPAAELVARAARRAVRGERASFPSLAAFRAAVVDAVRREEPLAALGGRRLRRLLVAVPGVKLTVRYTERADGPLPERCPVCDAELEPIRNRTLTGETVVLGRQCTRCAYWTHGARRVPVRYTISRGAPRTPRGRRDPTA